MQNYTVKVKSAEHVTHDVLRIVLEKPKDIEFKPGQATEISINKDGWKDKKRPFTFTSLPKDDFLEFTIKTYPSHQGVTNELLKLKAGDELILHDIFGDIGYTDEGIFIAGGAGVTPFISIFRNLESNNKIGNNKLIFANKTKQDIIHEEEFSRLLGANFINILSDENLNGYDHGFITEDFLKSKIDEHTHKFYVCGPPPMMDAIIKQLHHINITDKDIIKEAY
ncbi:FAD-binding oxidoreductase [Flavobacterium granuli]|uniref:Ferredoxin-NADP reductase n=1 Tax=Flavobacterium granuli TaxID=280093 RepID=A0A1M5IGQ3_9FLAO|nr:FAD-binding oxidoreductase [Flavobacterium granuli]PRZ27961.1 ferredoxin-NADP reductase [Flavobacterium granuli]SHG27508.1 Ferredoxin-NADP reductase [Flavobacterium granuli]